MSNPRQLPVDVDEIAEVMDMTTREIIDFYLDTQTGEVVVTGDGADEDIAAAIEDDADGRYERIPERESSDGYELMREFIATVGDAGFAERLSRAITGAGAFARFKREIAGRPNEQARWYAFRDAALRQDAIDWLRSLSLESTRVDAKP
jgi:hypothetical protein